jgi:hypothetical protein
MVRLISLVLAVLALCGQSIAIAQSNTLPPVALHAAGDDTENMRRCGVSYSSALAQAQATLRYNRISIESNQSPPLPPVRMSVNLHAVTPRYQDGRYDGGCTVFVDVKVSQFGFVMLPASETMGRGAIQFCWSGGSATGSRESLNKSEDSRLLRSSPW